MLEVLTSSFSFQALHDRAFQVSNLLKPIQGVCVHLCCDSTFDYFIFRKLMKNIPSSEVSIMFVDKIILLGVFVVFCHFPDFLKTA